MPSEGSLMNDWANTLQNQAQDLENWRGTMGGKPSKGTKKDKRLKENKPRKRRRLFSRGG
jgi:hypothetical protein